MKDSGGCTRDTSVVRVSSRHAPVLLSRLLPRRRSDTRCFVSGRLMTRYGAPRRLVRNDPLRAKDRQGVGWQSPSIHADESPQTVRPPAACRPSRRGSAGARQWSCSVRTRSSHNTRANPDEHPDSGGSHRGGARPRGEGDLAAVLRQSRPRAWGSGPVVQPDRLVPARHQWRVSDSGRPVVRPRIAESDIA